MLGSPCLHFLQTAQKPLPPLPHRCPGQLPAAACGLQDIKKWNNHQLTVLSSVPYKATTARQVLYLLKLPAARLEVTHPHALRVCCSTQMPPPPGGDLLS